MGSDTPTDRCTEVLETLKEKGFTVRRDEYENELDVISQEAVAESLDIDKEEVELPAEIEKRCSRIRMETGLWSKQMT